MTADQDLQETTARQRRAANPDLSAWVSANAGSGKTHVLIQRVIRLLLSGDEVGGTDPSQLLCITYTKAAAAEMEARLIGKLSDWALADDEGLVNVLHNEMGLSVSPDHLSRVRTLFARALETPGGLKIQTIHAFCESVLRRFPAEAKLLPGFEVMDDELGVTARNAIIEEVLGEAAVDPAARENLGPLIEDGRRANDLQSVLASIAPHALAMESATDIEVRLRHAYGVPEGSVDDWKRAALSRIDQSFLKQFHGAAWEASAAANRDLAEASATALEVWESDPLNAFSLLAGEWLNKRGSRPTPYKKMDSGIRNAVPDFMERREVLIDCLARVFEAEAALPSAQLTQSMYWLAQTAGKRYRAYKEERGLLDYHDLIERTGALLRDTSAAWVIYKLDQGIDHILLDEAQDTSPDQWEIIGRLQDEMWSGEGRKNSRSVFVVGDRKQSIYSFQGADAALFEQKRQEMAARAENGFAVEDVPLFLSFRSAQPVLDVVDELFVGAAGKGLHDGAGKQEHHKGRDPERFGRVELWPLVPHQPVLQESPWDAPVDTMSSGDPARVLANAVCDEINRLRSGERDGAAYGPGDVLILFQRRAAPFHEMIRTLSQRGIPTAGVDRIKFSDDVAVQDLTALLRVAANTNDNLSLAEVLTSPLWSFDQDMLFELAHGRGDKSLWVRMKECARASDDLGLACAAAVSEIERAMLAGATIGPSALLSVVLDHGVPTGWARIRSRLGQGSDEAILELLNRAMAFELKEPRSIVGFLDTLDRMTGDVKREVPEHAEEVRVMTVHAAKGLEAPIVFLADCGYKSDKASKSLIEALDDPGLWVMPPNKYCADDCPAKLASDDYRNRQMQEYRRKLYVGATRAEERLYFCGTQSGKNNKDAEDLEKATWHQLARSAFERLAERTTEIDCPWKEDMPIRVLSEGVKSPPKDEKPKSVEPRVAAPSWLFEAVPSEEAPRIHFPSTDTGQEPDFGPVIAPLLERPSTDAMRLRGLAVHSLLEHLPGHPPEDWGDMAGRLLGAMAGTEDKFDQVEVLEEVRRLLTDEHFAPVFGPGSRAEVAIAGHLGGKRYSGQIDRLIWDDNRALIVDFKSHREPPSTASKTPRDVVRQLAVYAALLKGQRPGAEVMTAVLWTHAPRLVEIPQAMLSEHWAALGL